MMATSTFPWPAKEAAISLRVAVRLEAVATFSLPVLGAWLQAPRAVKASSSRGREVVEKRISRLKILRPWAPAKAMDAAVAGWAYYNLRPLSRIESIDSPSVTAYNPDQIRRHF
jgi:hypothetical protein